MGGIPVARVVVNGVDVAQYLRPGGDPVAPDFGVLRCLVRHSQGADGAVAHRLGEAGEGVGQPRPVVHRGPRIRPDDLVEFGVDFGLDFGAVRH